MHNYIIRYAFNTVMFSETRTLNEDGESNVSGKAFY